MDRNVGTNTLEVIKGTLIKYFNNDFTEHNRQRHNVYQRAVYFALCRDLTPYALVDIGAVVNRDHASVLHGIKLFKNFKNWNEDWYIEIYNKARTHLKGDLDLKLIKRISIEDRYKELFLNHLMLKEKYSKAQEELNKIRNLDLIEV
tara:strand:- start:409 stop:849 length:441 start_codon:yes stop_codon:yes gene_type:complete